MFESLFYGFKCDEDVSLNPMPRHSTECKLKRAQDELREFVT